VDIGGTTTDIGQLVKGFPREAAARVQVNIIAQVLKYYRLPSLFKGVASKEYPANTKTANNKGSLFWAFWTLFDIEKRKILLLQPIVNFIAGCF